MTPVRDRKALHVSRHGTQSLERAFAVLRAVAEAGAEGIRLREVATSTDLHVATAHRLLGGLQRERAVSFDPYARVYHIGYDFLQREEESSDLRIRSHFESLVRRLAELTDDVVSLHTRHGLDALCIDYAQGSYPTPQLTLGIGGRRPLGVSAGGIALLAALSPKDLAATLDSNADRYSSYHLNIRQVRAMLRDCRREGYAFHCGYVMRGMRGICGVGMPLHSDMEQVIAAVSVSAECDRLAPQRLQQVARVMRSEVRRAGWFPAYLPTVEKSRATQG